MSPSSIMRRRQAIAGPSCRRGPAWVAAAILGVALVLTACDDATGPLPRTGVPDDLEFSIGAFSVGESTVELRGDTVVLRRWRPGAVNDSVRAVPTPDSWRTFWSATERAGVHRWRARYAAEGIARAPQFGRSPLTT